MATIDTASTGNFPDIPTPPLWHGQQLLRDEFERRYELMPDLQHVELIEGVVHMPSPVRVNHHGTPDYVMGWWLTHYWVFTPGVQSAGKPSIRLDMGNEPQPDGVLFIKPMHGGQARISDDDYLEGAPEMAVEVSASTAGIDLNEKFRVYRRNGVKEYIVWRVNDRAIDWFVLRNSKFERLEPDAAGIYRSTVFPGLWLSPESMIDFDLASVLAVLQEGLQTPEHAAFVAKLHQRQTR